MSQNSYKTTFLPFPGEMSFSDVIYTPAWWRSPGESFPKEREIKFSRLPIPGRLRKLSGTLKDGFLYIPPWEWGWYQFPIVWVKGKMYEIIGGGVRMGYEDHEVVSTDPWDFDSLAPDSHDPKHYKYYCWRLKLQEC